MDVWDELDRLAMLAEFLTLNVPQDSHTMAASKARIESISCEATRAETIGFLVAGVIIVIGTPISRSILLLPVWDKEFITATATFLHGLLLVVLC